MGDKTLNKSKGMTTIEVRIAFTSPPGCRWGHWVWKTAHGSAGQTQCLELDSGQRVVIFNNFCVSVILYSVKGFKNKTAI